MRHDLGHARTVALAFAFSFLIAIMLAGCASKPPANDYLPVQYSMGEPRNLNVPPAWFGPCAATNAVTDRKTRL